MSDDQVFNSRRVFLAGVGASAGLALTRGGQWGSDDVSNDSFQDLFLALEQSLSATQREYTFLAGDHPARQVTLTEAVHHGPHIGTLYNRYQRSLIKQMYTQMLSAQGQEWMRNTISLEGRFEGSIFKIYTQDTKCPSSQNSQVVINGGHYMLRSDDLTGSGYALGGPVSYGQQLGNNRYQVKGNAFKAHGDALNQFYQVLNENEKLAAYQNSPPNELLLQIQGDDGVFPGVKIGDVSAAAKEVAQDMLSTLFDGFNPEQQSGVWSALEHNGGIDALHVALYSDFGFYQDGKRYIDLSAAERAARGAPYIHVWRIEGPAFVIHFKGYPHVHAYMNVVRDPAKIAVGEALNEIPVALGQKRVKRLVTSMLKQRTSASLAFYPNAVLGRLSPGTVSTGSIFTLDPFGNNIVVADIATETMSSELIDDLTRQGTALVPCKRYRVATIDYMLRRRDLFGVPEKVSYESKTVRDALIEFVSDSDLSGFYG